MRLSTDLRGCVAAAWLTLAVSSAVDAQVASTTIQLPTVNTQSIGTTVVVPDRGTVNMGGLKQGSEFRSTPGGFSHRSRSSTMFNATATIHDIQGMEELTAWQVAEQLLAGGQVAEAISAWQKLQTEADDRELRQLAARKLEVLRVEGLHLVRTAVDRANTGDPAAIVEASRQVDAALDAYGMLIDRPEVRQVQRQLATHPAVAETRHGTEAAAYLAKARQAEAQGRLELAKVYYRMAANKQGTHASDVAQSSLQAMPSPSAAPPPAASVAAHLPDHIRPTVELARLYRRTDPGRANQLYATALQQLPIDQPSWHALRQEMAAVASLP